jgi:hypothetical protein
MFHRSGPILRRQPPAVPLSGVLEWSDRFPGGDNPAGSPMDPAAGGPPAAAAPAKRAAGTGASG